MEAVLDVMEGRSSNYKFISSSEQGSTSRRAPEERRIFVSNIPYEMEWQEVKDLFRDNVGDVTYVKLFEGR